MILSERRLGLPAVTSMIGNSQGETEIPPDLAEGVLPTGKAFVANCPRSSNKTNA